MGASRDEGVGLRHFPLFVICPHGSAPDAPPYIYRIAYLRMYTLEGGREGENRQEKLIGWWHSRRIRQVLPGPQGYIQQTLHTCTQCTKQAKVAVVVPQTGTS